MFILLASIATSAILFGVKEQRAEDKVACRSCTFLARHRCCITLCTDMDPPPHSFQTIPSHPDGENVPSSSS